MNATHAAKVFRNAPTLREQGARFVRRGDQFQWVHPLEMLPSDVDCTDMDDAEFEAFVLGAAQ